MKRLLEVHEKGNLNRLFIKKQDLLIFDELGYISLHKQGVDLLFQVISMRYLNQKHYYHESAVWSMESYFRGIRS